MGAEIFFQRCFGQIDFQDVEVGEFAIDGEGIVVFGQIEARVIALGEAEEQVGRGPQFLDAFDGQAAAAAAKVDDGFGDVNQLSLAAVLPGAVGAAGDESERQQKNWGEVPAHRVTSFRCWVAG